MNFWRQTSKFYVFRFFLYMMFLRTLSLCLSPVFKSLGERWAAVCRWTEERWHKLQEVFMVWQQLLSDQVGFVACSPPYAYMYTVLFSPFT